VRVIAGEFRSRRLRSVPGLDTRPTPDRMRQTLFDILGDRVEGAVFLDAYAGTGSVGIEALSRGAARAIFIERSKNAAKTLRENLVSLAVEGRALVILDKVSTALKANHADIVFLDPPYEREAEYSTVLKLLGEAPPAQVVVQHSTRLALQEIYGGLERYRLVKQGDNALTFYRPAGL